MKPLKELSAEKGMKWQIPTPAAPYQNGCAESLVKSTKIALKRGIGEQVLTPFELYTCLFFMEIYRDQFREFVCRYWSLKG